MRVLLCTATEMEIAPTLQALSLKENHTVDLLVTGVGLVASTYALAKEVAVKAPAFILQAGVAGSLEEERPPGSVVAVRSECIGDLGVNEQGTFKTLFDLQLLGTNTPPWQNGRLVNEGSYLSTLSLPVVDSVSVNEISTGEETIRYYREQLQVQVESMEGAALHYVALLEKIPFLQLRSISNFIGERDKTKWKMKEAIANLNRELLQHLTKLDAL